LHQLFSRETPFTISVFLDKSGGASGEIFVDDGDSLDTYSAGHFTHVRFGFRKRRFRSSKFFGLLFRENLNLTIVLGYILGDFVAKHLVKCMT
jgi:hypothetical protein